MANSESQENHRADYDAYATGDLHKEWVLVYRFLGNWELVQALPGMIDQEHQESIDFKHESCWSLILRIVILVYVIRYCSQNYCADQYRSHISEDRL